MISRLPGFHKLAPHERRRVFVELDLLDRNPNAGAPDLAQADRMVENAIGTHELPLGVGVNLIVNGRDRFAPMAIEEPSVVAAAGHAAKLLRSGVGIEVTTSRPLMIGQIQLLDVPDMVQAAKNIAVFKSEILERANRCDAALVEAGGGAVDIQTRTLMPGPDEDGDVGPMLVVHLLVDVREAMGANAVNTMCETLAPELAQRSGGRALLRILSNLADRRTVRAKGKVPIKELPKGERTARAIVEACVFAERDPYRAATHNKGIMNGVDAVLVALGQDWRAVEAGAHAFAARQGRYTALSRWRIHDDQLVGKLELPMAVGVVGGAVREHPGVRENLRLSGSKTADDVAKLAAAVGLAQNLAALRALSTEGIQQGHMRLHARKRGM